MIKSTANYYDKIYKKWISPERTDQEIILITKNLSNNAKILDIGCGTGRHLIPLSQGGFTVTGLEISRDMREVLFEKYSDANVLDDSVFQKPREELKNSFDRVICMWNAVFEIATTQEQLESFFQYAHICLKKDGMFIFSTGDSDNFEVQDYDFLHEVTDSNQIIQLRWQLVDFDKKTNTTVGEETITLINENGNSVDTAQRTIKQRHWLQSELVDVLEDVGFAVEVTKIAESGDKYFVCKK